MTTREQRIHEEASALWRELFGEAPPTADGAAILDMITSGLPEKRYDRLRSPHLRPSTIRGPRSPADAA